MESLFLLLPFLTLLPPSLSQPTNKNFTDCSPYRFSCGQLETDVKYPFLVENRPVYCGYPGFLLRCIDKGTPVITINGKEYQVKNIDYDNSLVTLTDNSLVQRPCPASYQNPISYSSVFRFPGNAQNLTLYFNCSLGFSGITNLFKFSCQADNDIGSFYYGLDPTGLSQSLSGSCSSTAVFPVSQMAKSLLTSGGTDNLIGALQEGFNVSWVPGRDWCNRCTGAGGVCGYTSCDSSLQTCFFSDRTENGSCSDKDKKIKKILIGVFAGVGGFILASTICFVWFRCKKRRKLPPSTAYFRSTVSSTPSYKDPELGGDSFRTHLFSYEELQEATNNFDTSNAIGDGGYGTVYKGKLQDGRVVAVKRLYDNNYKRVEQFINEIEILSQLRHPNLVSLYGCTSYESRDLLLVYEYVPNGTVADHLHGPQAPEGGLTWPIRLSIAIETADALSYLHAVEPPVMHRDVKTNNILLDCKFGVKVADFGLSRLFPFDATHVSTAPQGTPGYLDPQYHQFYHLTDKSDVYSFGVVLVELISSKPAVDITRKRNEINLASMAINRIQNGELEMLVDPKLGFEKDMEVRRMITGVAELAFRCLQNDGDMRPPIKEVVEVLREIKYGGFDAKKSVGSTGNLKEDTRALMKNKTEPESPKSVQDRWESRKTTPNNSG